MRRGILRTMVDPKKVAHDGFVAIQGRLVQRAPAVVLRCLLVGPRVEQLAHYFWIATFGCANEAGLIMMCPAFWIGAPAQNLSN